MKAIISTLAAAAIAAPAYAATYDITGSTADQSNLDFGTFTLPDSIVDSGSLDLFQWCGSANRCLTSGPWDQVSFDLVYPFQRIITGDADGDVVQINLGFGASGIVNGGSISLSGDAPDYKGLTANLQGTGSGFNGTWQPSEFADPAPITVEIAQVRGPVGGRRPIPEPASIAMLGAGLLGLTALRRRA